MKLPELIRNAVKTGSKDEKRGDTNCLDVIYMESKIKSDDKNCNFELVVKGWNYIYKETFQKPIKTFVEFFGIYEKRINNDYEKHNIQKEYGAVKRLSYPTFFLSKMLL